MTDPISHKLTTPEVQSALRLATLPPGRTSPFADLAPPASIDPLVVSSLQGKNVLNGNRAMSDAWRGALATLASPTHRASLFLGSPERWYSIEYFATTAALVGYSSDGAEHRITFPCTPANLMQALGDWLQWKEIPEPLALRVDLSAEELAALAAVADAYREESLRAFLERRQADPSRFSRDQLLCELQNISSADPRWLAGLLNRHAPSSFVPKAESLDGGARSLAARGWLKFEGNFAVLEGALNAICIGLSNLNPYVLLGVGAAGAFGSVVLVMRGLQFYWVLEFLTGNDGRSWARLQALGGPGLQAFVQGELDALPKAPAATTASWTSLEPAIAPTAVSARTPPMSSSPALRGVEPGPRSVPPLARERKCGKCGKTVLPGRAFCTGCGTAVA